MLPVRLTRLERENSESGASLVAARHSFIVADTQGRGNLHVSRCLCLMRMPVYIEGEIFTISNTPHIWVNKEVNFFLPVQTSDLCSNIFFYEYELRVYIWVTSRQLLKVNILKLLQMGFSGSKSAPKYNPRVLEQNIQWFKSYNQLKIRKFWFFSKNNNFYDFLTQKRETFCITH